MLKLGELYLNGQLDILESKYNDETESIIQRIRYFTADISQSGKYKNINREVK